MITIAVRRCTGFGSIFRRIGVVLSQHQILANVDPLNQIQ